jgi:hypothetical protein
MEFAAVLDAVKLAFAIMEIEKDEKQILKLTFRNILQ